MDGRMIMVLIEEATAAQEAAKRCGDVVTLAAALEVEARMLAGLAALYVEAVRGVHGN